MRDKKRKEFTKLNILLKMLLKKMYKQYGFEQAVKFIKQMKNPTLEEKYLMLDYINELNDKAER